MTPDETAQLLSFVTAVTPSQKVNAFTGRAWAVVLDDISYADAYAAVVALAKKQSYISPSEVRLEVARRRHDRASRHLVPVPDCDPDNVPAYLSALRDSQRRSAESNPRMEA